MGASWSAGPGGAIPYARNFSRPAAGIAGSIRSGKRPLMKNELLSRIESPADLRKLSDHELEALESSLDEMMESFR